MSTIVVNKLQKKYHKEKIKITVLDNLSVSFDKGKFYAIVGESGAGKSTLLKCISLLCPIDAGIITINDIDISKLNDNELSEIRLNEIGMIFQDYNLLNYLSSLENVMLPLLMYKDKNISQCKQMASKILEYVGLEKRENHYPKELSGGEQQRVAIARALVNNPSIILADEPTGNLDKKNKMIILKLLRKIADNNKCVVVVTHDSDVLQFADKILSLADRKLINYEL